MQEMKPLRYHGKGAALVAGLVLLAACGGQDEEAAAAAAQAAADSAAAAEAAAAAPLPVELDACGLITAAEAQQIIGVEVGEPTRDANDPNVCKYSVGPASMGGQFNIVTRMVYSMNASEELVQQYKDSGITTTEAAGIGERSFWAPQQNMTQLNTFFSGNHIMLTMAYVGPDAKQRTLVEKLMQTALAKQQPAAAPQEPAPAPQQ
jgi:hypothetical protein